MGKRIMASVVGAGIGSLVGVAARFFGAGDVVVFAGAIAGAVLMPVVLGRPGR